MIVLRYFPLRGALITLAITCAVGTAFAGWTPAPEPSASLSSAPENITLNDDPAKRCDESPGAASPFDDVRAPSAGLDTLEMP
ncbi:hypothetical protein [Corallococcus llansteffanensis]|uniref:Uncharacterized protein n=1 Tax=Corallococcus llansteffanensis TaxID=2316731 RepID=A0A3A8QH31_9BACT|nr:hypothetical protein [Corallococcus llansteffanensis]RKH68006.1 hypothetical protein D7V93_02010 [Corallococcus llansteffanensis]